MPLASWLRWPDHRVAAGLRRSLRGPRSALAWLVLVACSGPVAPPPPDILLITIDTHRRDHVGVYGHPEPITPTLDRLAAEGLVFDDVVTVAGTTFPAHGSMLTGLYPRQHGARGNGHRLADGVPTIAQALSDAGYQTASFVSYRGMHFNGSLDRGFEVASDRTRRRGAPPIRPGDETVAQLRRWLAERDDPRPLFVWLHLFEPHSPYEPSEYAAERLGDYAGVAKDGASTELIERQGEMLIGSPPDHRAVRALYAGEVLRADRLVDEASTAFADAAGPDRVTIVTADHGEALGEADHFGHGAGFLEAILRVPLILHDTRNRHGARIGERVSVLDVAPTIAALAGVEPPPTADGVSLLDVAGGEAPAERVLFAVTALPNPNRPPDARLQDHDPEAVALYAGRYKWQRLHGETQLFELDGNAPPRPIPQPAAPPGVWDRLTALADEFVRQPDRATDAELDAEEIEALRALGYL